MRSVRISALCWIGLLVVAGCASTKITSSESQIGDQKLARPGRILVYDFVATPSDMPSDSALAGAVSEQPQSAKDIETGRALGASVAEELVKRIDAVGLPGERGTGAPAPQVNDLVIRGYFVSVDKGSAAERLLIGFGSGAADLKTVVEAFQMTPNGMRRLGSGELDSGGGKSPGLVVPIIVTAATANPIGLIVGGAVKTGMELSGMDSIQATGKRTADEIADRLDERFKEQGWIE